MQFTKEELKAIQYHLRYDLETCTEAGYETMVKEYGIDLKASESALEKVDEMLEEEECSYCGGEGVVETTEEDDDGRVLEDEMPCPVCRK